MIRDKRYEIWEAYNARASLHVKGLFQCVDKQGKANDKILISLVQRDHHSNMALVTVQYFLDLTPIKLYCYKVLKNQEPTKFEDFKDSNGRYRGLWIVKEAECYRLSIINGLKPEQKSLYFRLSRGSLEVLAKEVYDHISWFQREMFLQHLKD